MLKKALNKIGGFLRWLWPVIVGGITLGIGYFLTRKKPTDKKIEIEVKNPDAKKNADDAAIIRNDIDDLRR